MELEFVLLIGAHWSTMRPHWFFGLVLARTGAVLARGLVFICLMARHLIVNAPDSRGSQAIRVRAWVGETHIQKWKCVAVLEKFLFRKIEVWISLAVVAIMFTVGIFALNYIKRASTTGGTPSALGRILIDLADVPDNISLLMQSGVEVDTRAGGFVQRNPQLLNYDYPKNLTSYDDGFVDDGYLLVSAYSDEDKVSIVYLLEMSTQEVLWKWVPRPSEIVASSAKLTEQSHNGTLSPYETNASFKAEGPALLPDGNLVISASDGSLSRWSACGDLVWANDRRFHHGLEASEEGLIVPIVLEGTGRYAELKEGLRDDGYAMLDLDGNILLQQSIMDLLFDNGYMPFVLGRAVDSDAIHLNKAEIIQKSDAFVKAGDVMLSARHLSAVFLYRPSNNKIIWYKQGPWLGQHDIDYQGDGVFSLYGNDAALGLPARQMAYEHSTIYLYNSVTGQIEKPYDAVFAQLQIGDASSSTYRILRNGDAFVEQSTSGIMWRLSAEGPRWRYVHKTGDGIGAMNWSRYYYADEINLDWIGKATCRK